MLTLHGKRQRYCDGLSRRGFMKIGALAMGGLTMADLLRMEAYGQTGRKKSIINIYLGGGPTHMDTFDLKPDAPAEFRGEFRPIPTNASGLEICELMPNLAKHGDKFAVIRSVSGLRNEHNASQSDSGWSQQSMRNIGGRPGIGACMSRILGPDDGRVPTNMSLTGYGQYGFLGPAYGAYRPNGPGRDNLKLNGITLDRLGDRRNLLSNLDRMRNEVDQKGKMTAIDSFTERAMNVITSSQLADALNTRGEDPRIRDRYGVDNGGRYRDNERFLLARRLVEVGVRCVSFSWGGWDTHGNNFKSMRDQLPALDRGMASLLEDLSSRGMLEDTIIMMSGEFGRTPRINNGGGRDHWSKAGFFFLAGGGFRTGQAIGATNRLGEEPQDRPVHLQHIFTTLYHQLGINPEKTHFSDPNGRPQYLVDERELIHELI